MFTCKACARRAFASLASQTPRPYKSSPTPRPLYASNQYRQPKPKSEEAGASVESTKQDETSKDHDNLKVSRTQDWAAQKQLQYLKDPLHIADHVHKVLEKGDFTKAIIITRKASKDTKVTVSWNYLIDHEIRRDKIHTAIKLYNEMKKRAQFPNAQTFTIIFRGLASSVHSKLAVSEAVRIYNTMLTTSSRIKPNTIHMNAVLQVCAKAEDIDAMFSIAETANDGLRAPNGLTYTTIFNALRAEVDKPVHQTLQDLEIQKSKAEAVRRAKSVWLEVISKWRAGSIIIDEELVCAMGRVLLMGDYHDAKSIETLIQQTMMISLDNKFEALKSPEGNTNPNEPNTDLAPPVKVDSKKIKAPGAPTIRHALPGNNSLSMVLLSLEKTGETTSAHRYWYIFTKQHRVVPDANNWHQLLATLRRGKNSHRTMLYLRQMPSNLMAPKNFRTAMNTCLRDNLNPSGFIHATDILNTMVSKLTSPDVKAMQTYLRAAYANKRCFQDQFKDEEAAMMAWGKQLTEALENVWKPFTMAAKQYEDDGPETYSKGLLVTLARKMIAAYDRVIFSKMASPEVEEKIKPRRNSLNRIVVRHFEQMNEINPNYRPSDVEGGDDEEFAGVFQQQRDKPMRHSSNDVFSKGFHML